MLEVKDITFNVKGTQILNGISFQVAQGETVGIIGPNGSGKTTLFNCLSGFNIPNGGSITLKGHEVTVLPPYKRAALGLGRVFQNFGIFREMTCTENVVTALESRQPMWDSFFPWSKGNKTNRARALEFLKEVHLEKSCDKRASSLSGGQMRLLEIIRTLAFEAEVFLLDEPTAGVSPKMKEDVAGLIRRLKELGKTVLVIEHDINFIQKFCSRIIVLDIGRIVLDDTPDKVRQHSLLQEIYFGSTSGNGS
ncbi:MAG: ABC transporter ATP-binding protein [Deltaproteobacteria bacterium]|nr:ABC transporter ATP-binding protein [Deltaproteobacteria bacterium]